MSPRRGRAPETAVGRRGALCVVLLRTVVLRLGRLATLLGARADLLVFLPCFFFVAVRFLFMVASHVLGLRLWHFLLGRLVRARSFRRGRLADPREKLPKAHRLLA